jgi:hypothetical protein
MDERIEKAFAVANFATTLANQRRVALEEYSQKLVYYFNGATFKVSPELIAFIKTVLDLGYTSDVPFLDANDFPIVVADVQEFLDNVVSVYFEAVNEYTTKYAEIKKKRKISDIVEL